MRVYYRVIPEEEWENKLNEHDVFVYGSLPKEWKDITTAQFDSIIRGIVQKEWGMEENILEEEIILRGHSSYHIYTTFIKNNKRINIEIEFKSWLEDNPFYNLEKKEELKQELLNKLIQESEVMYKDPSEMKEKTYKEGVREMLKRKRR